MTDIPELKFSTKRPTALVLEDIPDVAEIIGYALMDLGFDVKIATTEKELETLSEEFTKEGTAPNFIWSDNDYGNPKDNIKWPQLLKKNLPKIPERTLKFLITADVDKETQNFERQGIHFQAAFPKPFQIIHIERRIVEGLKEHQGMDWQSNTKTQETSWVSRIEKESASLATQHHKQ